MTTKNRFKALENLCEDFCAKEQDDAFENVSNLKTVDKKENNENEKILEGMRMRSKTKNDVKKCFNITEQEKAFLDQFEKIVLGTFMPK